MKKFLSILMALVLLCGTACAAEKITVVTTIFPQYDFVRAIAGDRVELTMLLKPGAEVHSFEPTPQDILAIAGCDLFVYGGGESDEWANGLLESTASEKRQVLAMMDVVGTLEEEADHEHDDQEEEAEYDEHVWTSPVNAVAIVNALCDRLCAISPENEAFFRANAADYAEKLTELDASFRETVENGVRKTVIFGDRFPFLYFVKEYGLDYVSAFPGCSSETEPSAATMAKLIGEAIEVKAPVVFCLEMSNGGIARAVAEQTGAETRVFYSCQTVTPEDFESGKTYLDLMGENVESLRDALN